MEQQRLDAIRLGEYKAEIEKLSVKYEANITAVPNMIPTDNGFKIGAVINIIDNKVPTTPEQHEQIQNPSEEDSEQGKSE